MAFFRNSAVNLLNAHYGIHALAISGGGVFYAAYLLKAGVSAPLVLAAMAAIFAGRFAIRPFIVLAARRVGLKPLVIVGALICAVEFPILSQVRGLDAALAALILVSSVGDTVYWTSYHAYFAALGDPEHRGHQISVREAIAAVVGIVGPLAGGWALATLGPGPAFGATAVVMAASALPLISAPNVAVTWSEPGAFRAALSGFRMFVADGINSTGFAVIWPIALFLTLGENYEVFGGAMALAAVAGAVSGMLLGRAIDLGHGSRAVWIGVGSMAALTALRAAFATHPVMAVVANAIGPFATAVYTPVLMTAVYNNAKAAPCVLRFHIATEGGFDAGASLALLIGAGLVWAGVPIGLTSLISLIGLAANGAMLRGYYGRAAVQPA
jgi:hypothetical protein